MNTAIQTFLREDFSINTSVIKGGNQALVQKGSHPVHGDVAIKQYYDGYCDNENPYHENIVPFIGVLVDRQLQMIGYIMPYMSMGSLRDIIHNKNGRCDRDTYTNKQITSWITQISKGLFYLHSKQIIHRDIKPSNVLLGKSLDDVRLSDFGLSRSLENTTQTLTKGIGTPIYMAPEIIRGENYDISVDIYSLSITIWEILYRRVPFDHVMANCTDAWELQHKISNGDRPELENDLSKEVADLCWHDDASFRPKINDVLQFSTNIEFEVPEKETIILLGGNNGSNFLNSLLVLQNNGENGEIWKELTIKLPYPIHRHGAQFFNNNLYIFGGGIAQNQVLNSTYKLSKSLQWEKMADMNQKREGISNSSVLLNDQMWVLGGSNGNEKLKTVEMYDPVANKWEYRREMNACRSFAAAAAVIRKIFCCGGWNGIEYLSSTECYDPSSDVWTLICDIPQASSGLSAVEIDGNLIVMGGWAGREHFNSVWALDTTDQNTEWISRPCISLSRKNFSIAKIDGKIFVCGGSSERKIDADVEIFDGEVWRNGPRLGTPRNHGASTVVSMRFAKILEYKNTGFRNTKTQSIRKYADRTIPISKTIEKETILLLGGADENMHLDSLLVLQSNGENEDVWKELTIKLPYPIHRHGAQFFNNNLYIFGGEKAENQILNSTYKLSKNSKWHKLSKSLKWKKMADMNEKRWCISYSSVIFNDRIWVLGGMDETRALNSVEAYNPITNEWKYMREMNELREYAAAAVVNRKIFCCGGWNKKKKYLNSAECYDSSSDIWTFISDMPGPTAGNGAVGMDNYLIVIGGWAGGEVLNSTWVLNTTDENAEWMNKPCIPFPRAAFSIVTINSKIFICGGRSEEKIIADVNIFDGETWRDGPMLKTPHWGGSAIVIPMKFAKYFK